MRELIENALRPFVIESAFERITTREGPIEITSLKTHFSAIQEKLTDPSLSKTYRSKPLVVVEGEVLFGELAILKCLQKFGFDGVWIDTFHGRGKKLFWKSMPRFEEKIPVGNVTLPDSADRIYEAIRAKNTENKRDTTGFFDVFAWKNDECVFLDYKGRGDRVRDTQLRWLTATISAKIQPRQLFFVTY